jgi:hypothetical protein
MKCDEWDCVSEGTPDVSGGVSCEKHPVRACQSRHPEKPELKCWHGIGHRGLHNYLNLEWTQ